MRRIACLLASASLILGAPDAVRGQGVAFDAAITSGYLRVEPSGGASYVGSWGHYGQFDVRGEGFHVTNFRTEPGSVDAAVACDAPGCQAGETISLSSAFVGSYLGSGPATIGAVTISPAYYEGAFRLVAGTVSLPPGNRKDVVLSVPFTLQPGPLYVHDSGARSYTSLVATGRLSGHGTVTVFLERVRHADLGDAGKWFYRITRIVYSFE